MKPPYPFDTLPEKSKRENNWLSRNYHGIEWFDGETDFTLFTLQLREIARRARYIYSRGHEKVHYLCHLLSRSLYNLEEISPSFKNLPVNEEGIQHCSHHGFRCWPKDKFHCALRNAYKLKNWLDARNKRETSYFDLSPINCDISSSSSSESEETSSSGFIKRRNLDKIRNIEAWRRNNLHAIKEEEKYQTEEAKANHSSEPIIQAREEENFSTINKAEATTSPLKEVNSEFIQIIPLARSSPRCEKHEFTGNFTSVATTQCQICGRLSCRQTAKGVDEVDCHRR